jgi:hypothetical protein
LWDEPTTHANLKQLLSGKDEEVRLYYAAKILREARFEEVWEYLSPTFYPQTGVSSMVGSDERKNSGNSSIPHGGQWPHRLKR